LGEEKEKKNSGGLIEKKRKGQRRDRGRGKSDPRRAKGKKYGARKRKED